MLRRLCCSVKFYSTWPLSLFCEARATNIPVLLHGVSFLMPLDIYNTSCQIWLDSVSIPKHAFWVKEWPTHSHRYLLKNEVLYRESLSWLRRFPVPLPSNAEWYIQWLHSSWSLPSTREWVQQPSDLQVRSSSKSSQISEDREIDPF